MRVLLQRVSKASVEVQERSIASIKKGLLLFLGVEEADEKQDADWLVRKIINARIFEDTEGKVNFSLQEVTGEILVVSQFTLHASIKKGNRPSFINAANPEKAEELYIYFVQEMEKMCIARVKTGAFGANMQVSLINSGPFTLWYDSKNRL